MIAMAVALVIVVAITTFLKNTFIINSSAQASLSAQLESRSILRKMVAEFREMNESETGAYAIESASTSTITFYVEVTGDSNTDRVRYYLDSADGALRRGLVVASGNPPSYNLGAETFTTIVNDISNSTSTPLFEYYDGNYAGTSSPLSYPLTFSQIRLIKINIKIDKDSNRAPTTTEFTTQTTLRNIKDNL